MTYEPLQFNGRDVQAAVEGKLTAHRRKLLRLQVHKGICQIGNDRYEIQVDKLGYVILTINGERNQHLEPEVA